MLLFNVLRMRGIKGYDNFNTSNVTIQLGNSIAITPI